MASISKYNSKGGDALRAVQFVGADRKRRSIRLGALPAKSVEDIRDRITLLEAYRKSGGSPDPATIAWLGRIDREVYATLAAGGLVEARADEKPQGVPLGKFLAEYITRREGLAKAGKISPGTLRIDKVTRDCLVDKFGAEKCLTEFTRGDAEDFRSHLLTRGGSPVKRCGPEQVVRDRRPLAEATTRKRCAIACKFFAYAVRRELVRFNPFDTETVPRANIATRRTAYIAAADAQAVIEQLPTIEWKLLFALCRWGGLRVGEPRLLTWADVLWDQQKLLVHCEKTEHIIGHETRLVPLFPEIAGWLEKRFDEATNGDRHVLPLAEGHHCDETVIPMIEAARDDARVLPMMQGRTNAAFRKTLERAIERAGVTAWPRLWHNLRGTRQNELLEAGFKRKAVCAWLGNSSKTAAEHYEKVTDADYRAATAPLNAPPADKPRKNA